MLWQYVGQVAPRGNIGVVSDLEIAGAVAWEKKPHTLVVALVKCGWLEENSEHRLIVHDWPHHCDTYIQKILNRKKIWFLPIYDYSNPAEKVGEKCLPKSGDFGGQISPVMDTKSEPLTRGIGIGNSIETASEEKPSTRAREDLPLDAEEIVQVIAATPKIQRLRSRQQREKANAKAKTVEITRADLLLGLDGYIHSKWAKDNGFPVFGFLKDPHSWIRDGPVDEDKPEELEGHENRGLWLS